MMTKDSGQQDAYQSAIKKEESVLFDETDKDHEDQSISYDKKLTLTDSNNESSISLSSDGQGGLSKKATKLVDKSKRAFSISIDSSKAFELAIRRPRTECKNYWASFKGAVYSVYLLLLKQNGSPAEHKDLTMYFVLFSALIALDLMLLINYSLHIFMPLFNFQRIGWAYVVYVFGAPYLSPLIAISGAFGGSVRLLKYSSYMSSMTILANIPLSVIIGIFVGEDPVYWLLFCFIIIIKMG
jgi:hypothetical protein